MNCELTSGKSVLCRENNQGGIVGAIIGRIADIATCTASNGAISAMTMAAGTQAFQFDVEDETSNFGEVVTGNRQNRTKIVLQTLTLSNNDFETATRNSSEELMEGKFFAVVKYANGDRKIAGLSVDRNGAISLSLSPGLMGTTFTHNSGTAKEDKNGDDWVFEAKTAARAFTISEAISESLLDYVS